MPYAFLIVSAPLGGAAVGESCREAEAGPSSLGNAEEDGKPSATIAPADKPRCRAGARDRASSPSPSGLSESLAPYQESSCSGSVSRAGDSDRSEPGARERDEQETDAAFSH